MGQWSCGGAGGKLRIEDREWRIDNSFRSCDLLSSILYPLSSSHLAGGLQMGSEERASFLRQIPQLDDGLLESAVRDEILLALGQPRSPKIAWKLRALRQECNRRRKG